MQTSQQAQERAAQILDRGKYSSGSEVSREENFKKADYCFSKFCGSENTSQIGEISFSEGNGYCFLKAYQRPPAGRQHLSEMQDAYLQTRRSPTRGVCRFCSHTEGKNSRLEKGRSDLRDIVDVG